MLRALTPVYVGIVVVLLWLFGGGPAGSGLEIELTAAGQDRNSYRSPTQCSAIRTPRTG